MVYHRVFQERNIGHIAHTAASRRLVEDSHAMDALGSQFDEAWQAFAHVCFSNFNSLCRGTRRRKTNVWQTVEAMEKFKNHEPNTTVSIPLSLRFNRSLTTS